LKSSVAGAFGSIVEGSESPVFWIERNGCDAITTCGEEGFEFTARLKVAANVEEGMAEVAHGFAVLREKSFGDGFAANDRLLEILEADFVERGVREGVIAEFEAGVEPLIERGDARVNFADVHVELVFIDKADGGNLLLLKRRDDVRRHVRQLLGGHGLRGAGGKVIDGDDDAALGRSLRAGDGNEDESEQGEFRGAVHAVTS